MSRYFFRVFYLLIILFVLGLLAVKLVTFWIPEWSPTFYLISGVLGVCAIAKLLLKTIRLQVGEFAYRRDNGIVVLSPLHYEMARRNPLTLRKFLLASVRLGAVVGCVLGGGWYASAHNLLPFQAARTKECVAQPTPMPMVPNDVPSVSGQDVTALWHGTKVGENDAQFQYGTSGFLSNHALSVKVTNYHDGTAGWSYTLQPAMAGDTYQYADWYQSNVTTALVITYILNGVTKVDTIDQNIPAAQGWRHYSVTFDIPDDPNANSVLVSVSHELASIGRLQVDDILFHPQFSSFVRPMISLTFDDGFRSQYTNALPLLCKYHMPATFYIVSEYVEYGYEDYLLPQMVSGVAQAGMEIGDHTLTHPHLPRLSSAEVEEQIALSQTYLKQFGKIVDFASPYGEVNDADLRLIKQLYQSHRNTDVALNTASDFDPYNIMCITIDSGEGTDDVQKIEQWIDQAIQSGGWLVLAFHQIDGPHEKYYENKDPFNEAPQKLEQILSYITTHHIQPMTIDQGLSEVYQQI